MTSAILIGGFLVLFLLRVPVTMAIGIPAVVATVVGGHSLLDVPRYMMSGVDSFVLLSIPFFVLAGNLFNIGGATSRLFAFCEMVFGRLPGGLAQVCIGAGVVFSGMSGAALADIAGLGTIAIKAMRESGYRDGFSAAVNLASSTLGPIIPPSIMFIVYAAATNVSVGRLFLAGIGAGLLIALFLAAYIAVAALSRWEVCPRPPRVTVRGFGAGLRASFLALLAPVVILGAMRSGVVTATEAGVVAVLYAVFLGVAYRGFTLGSLRGALVNSAMMSASILYMIAVSTVMGHLLTVEGVAQAASAAIRGITVDPILGMLIVNVLLLVIGCVLETAPALLITAPLLLPVAVSYGVDPVHFGVIICFNLIIGIVHPPMGIGLFVISSISRIGMEEITRAIIPFLVPLLAALVVITYVPAVCLWLPNLVFGPPR